MVKNLIFYFCSCKIWLMFSFRFLQHCFITKIVYFFLAPDWPVSPTSRCWQKRWASRCRTRCAHRTASASSPALLATRWVATWPGTSSRRTSPCSRTGEEEQKQGITKRCRLSLLTNSALVIRVQMGGGGCGVSANEYRCSHHVTWSPNKLWRSTSLFNLWSETFQIWVDLLRI